MNTDSAADLNLEQYLQVIKECKNNWAFADDYGTLFTFFKKRLRKFNNVVTNRASFVQDTRRFFGQLQNELNQTPFVQITVGEYCRVTLYLCHRAMVRLHPGCKLVLFGNVAFTRNFFAETNIETVPVRPMSNVTLNHRNYRVRINSNVHLIFVRSEDIMHDYVHVSNTIQLPSDGEDDENTSQDSAEPERTNGDNDNNADDNNENDNNNGPSNENQNNQENNDEPEADSD